jgi:spore germination protein
LGIRDKLLDFKRRLSDRKMYSIVVVLIAAVAMWGMYQYRQACDLRQQLDNQYNRAFFDMVGYVRNVESMLAKSLVASTPSKTAATLQSAWGQATLAQTNLGQLPVSQPVLASTSKFLTQVGDLSNTLNYQNVRGKPMSDEQYNTVEKLYNYSIALGEKLAELQASISEGRLKWGELSRKGTRLFKKAETGEAAMKQLEAVGDTFQDYPTLIYDGPFSDHMLTMEPKGLTGENVSQEEAKESVKKFLGLDDGVEIESTGKDDTSKMKSYSYIVTPADGEENRQISIGVTQKGGRIMWMLSGRPVEEEKLSIEEAKKKGLEFLESKGIKNMVDTYYMTEANVATINYAYKEEGDIIVYPDLIKVKVALDDGEVIGYEATGYLACHTERELKEPGISMEEARAKINPRLEVESSGMAIIPTDYKSEILCYEFKGKVHDRDFLIYINAENGQEEDILIIVNTENGVLTM